MTSKVRLVQELRRGNAATPIPSRKTRRKMTRRDSKQAAIKDQA